MTDEVIEKVSSYQIPLLKSVCTILLLVIHVEVKDNYIAINKAAYLAIIVNIENEKKSF